MKDYSEIITGRIYGCFSDDPKWGGYALYYGSSHLPLKKTEYNHRNASWLTFNGKPYKMTKFRKALLAEGKDWWFDSVWEDLRVSRALLEWIEQATIQGVTYILKQKGLKLLNTDLRPYDTSYDVYERISPELDKITRAESKTDKSPIN